MVLQHRYDVRYFKWRMPGFTCLYCCSFKHQALSKKGYLPMEKLLQNQIGNIDKQVKTNNESLNVLNVRMNNAEQYLVRIDEHLVQLDDHLIRLDKRFDKVDDQFVRLEKKRDDRFARVDERFAKADERFGRIEASIDVIASNYLNLGTFHKEMRAHTAWMISCMFAIASLTVAAAKLLFAS